MRDEGAATASAVAESLARGRARAAMWLEPEYRRAGIRLLLLNWRRLAGWRLALAVGGAALGVVAWSAMQAPTPRELFTALSAASAAMAVILGSTLFSDDLRKGSLELLWLSTGSPRALLRMKIASLLLLFGLLLAPAVAAAVWFSGGGLSFWPSYLFLLTNAWLFLAATALAGTFAPQGWLAALGVLALAGAGYWMLHDTVAVLNPFLNPVAMGPTLRTGGGAFAAEIPPQAAAIPNRIVMAIAALMMQRSAAARLAKVLR